MPTKATKSESATVKALQEQLAALQAQLSKLTGGETAADVKGSSKLLSVAQVEALTAEDMDTLRYSFVKRDEDGSFEIERGESGRPQYALHKGVQREWYMAVKGFATTLKKNGELSATPNDKGRSQIQYAREILGAIKAAGFAKFDSVGNGNGEPKAKRGRPRKA